MRIALIENNKAHYVCGLEEEDIVGCLQHVASNLEEGIDTYELGTVMTDEEFKKSLDKLEQSSFNWGTVFGIVLTTFVVFMVWVFV